MDPCGIKISLGHLVMPNTTYTDCTYMYLIAFIDNASVDPIRFAIISIFWRYCGIKHFSDGIINSYYCCNLAGKLVTYWSSTNMFIYKFPEACVIREVCRAHNNCCKPWSEGSMDIISGLFIETSKLFIVYWRIPAVSFKD